MSPWLRGLFVTCGERGLFSSCGAWASHCDGLLLSTGSRMCGSSRSGSQAR